MVAKPTMSEAQATYTSAGPVVVTSLPEATKVRFTAGPEATKQSTALSTVASQSSRVVLVEPTKASESSSEPEVLEKPSSVSSLPTVVVVPQASEQVTSANKPGHSFIESRRSHQRRCSICSGQYNRRSE